MMVHELRSRQRMHQRTVPVVVLTIDHEAKVTLFHQNHKLHQILDLDEAKKVPSKNTSRANGTSSLCKRQSGTSIPDESCPCDAVRWMRSFI